MRHQGTHCYRNDGDLLEAAEQALKVELTDKQATALSTSAEHLDPEPPITVTSALVNLLSTVGALLVLLTVKGMALFGIALPQFVQNLFRQVGLMPGGEPVGFRRLYERHFRHITELLGKRRLVLFIDDLDRCDREHCVRVLETTNFLVSAGEVFIVLGLAPRYVLANVTLQLSREMANAVHEADEGAGPDADEPEPAPAERRGPWFARHCLQKLINIEVPVPRAGSAEVRNLLGDTGGERDLDEEAELRLARLGQRLGQLLQGAVLVGAMLGAGYYASWLISPAKLRRPPLSEDLGADSSPPRHPSKNQARAERRDPANPRRRSDAPPSSGPAMTRNSSPSGPSSCRWPYSRVSRYWAGCSSTGSVIRIRLHGGHWSTRVSGACGRSSSVPSDGTIPWRFQGACDLAPSSFAVTDPTPEERQGFPQPPALFCQPQAGE